VVRAAIHELIDRADGGEDAAAQELFASLYAELHRLAEHHLHRGAPEVTLGTTTLLHEAYLNITSREALSFPDRGRFLAYASRAMRGLIIDYTRRRRAKKRGGEFHITLAGDDEPGVVMNDERLQQLSEALDELARLEAPLAQLVDLHFFCGLTFDEIASLRNVSVRTVHRDWRAARLLLHRSLQSDDEPPAG
jgi:RNA polymerase sigma factor (TIGR02999 family)